MNILDDSIRCKSEKNFPIEWGPPSISLKKMDDFVLFPDGYGCGSSVMLKWIKEKKAEAKKPEKKPE